MMEQLKQESLLEKMNNRPGKKRESKSEAAKIARYNIKLLESIYQAYDPEHADHVVKVFRKGGVFSVEPIMEEDFEESFDTQNDIESQGTTEINAAVLGGVGIAGDDEKNKDKQGKGNKLGDIKEENSFLLQDLEDDDDKTEGQAKLQMLNAADQSENTGFDFDNEDQNDLFGTNNGEDINAFGNTSKAGLKNQGKASDTKFGSLGKSTKAGFKSHKNASNSKYNTFGKSSTSDFNALLKASAAAGLANGINDGSGRNKDRYSKESSSEYDDETLGITMNPRRRRKKRKLKKKKQPTNDKYKQLEAIYGPNAIGSIRVSFVYFLVFKIKRFIFVKI